MTNKAPKEGDLVHYSDKDEGLIKARVREVINDNIVVLAWLSKRAIGMMATAAFSEEPRLGRWSFIDE